MRFLKNHLGIVAMCGILVLTGCSASSGYSILDRDPRSADALPSAVLENAKEIAADTSRFVGTDNGVSLWIAKDGRLDGICLVIHTENQGWTSACGGSVVSNSGYTVYPDGTPTPDGMRKISENVFETTVDE